jgi:PAS domain S-box-containing protein
MNHKQSVEVALRGRNRERDVMDRSVRVLVVEDSAEDTLLIMRELQRGGFQVELERVATRESMAAALEQSKWDIIISDYSLPRFSGPAALALYLEKDIDLPFIIVSGTVGEERAVEVIKAGAHDYVSKENLSRLVPAVEREMRAAQERRIRRHTEETATYLASLVESCDDAIIGSTLDGTVVSWNSGAERLYGYPASEMVGRSISVLFPAFRPGELAETLEHIRRGHHIDSMEGVRIRKDGRRVEVSVRVSPILDDHGRIIGASGIARDITQRKLEENERLVLIQELTASLAFGLEAEAQRNPAQRSTL